MLPKSYVVFKWLVYASATLLLFALQSLVLNHIHVYGLTPFLYPILPAVVAMYEGNRRGPVFALVLGAVCDTLLHGPFTGFFAIVFPMIAIFAAMVGENFLSPGFLCCLVVSASAMLLTGGMRILVQVLSAGGGYLTLMAWITVGETLLTLPAMLVVMPLYRTIHRRCASDY